MPVSITIPDVPERTREVLTARAARAGKSLEDYLRGVLTAMAHRPSPDEFWEPVRHRVRVTGTRLPADFVLEARDRDRR